MAVLTSPHNYAPLFIQGTPDTIALFALKDVTAGDTADLSGWFEIINRVVVMGLVSFVEIAANFTGTVVTMPNGLNADPGYLLAWGSGV
jgi:hypothetical protein